jgi:ABC-type phosphate/phosphonate transport system substrate-binding protein
MSRTETLILGAVAYDPKVVTIWDGFQRHFALHDLPFDYILYSNYERQVEAHFRGHLHVAWNSPLAWIQSQRIAEALGRKAEAIAMRDSDCDLTSVILVRADSGIHEIANLRGKRIAVGAHDSPQATLIPLGRLASQGIEPNSDCEVLPFDLAAGKHGDHIGGEREAVRALLRGDAEAACILDANHLLFSQEGTLPSGATRILDRTPPYDHCNFTMLDGAPQALVAEFRRLLFAMSYADPLVRPLLDLEGLKQWRPGRTTGYAQLEAAVTRFRTIDAFVEKVVAQCR